MRSLFPLVLAAGCFHGPVAPAPAPSTAPLHVAGPPPMTRAQARTTLARLPEREQRLLGELWFMYELQDVSGNEGVPARLLHRMEREFADPLVVDRAAVQSALAEARALASTIPDGTPGEDYTKGSQVAAPVLGVILSPEEVLRRLATYPEEVSLAVLVEQYFSDAHYHSYNMQDRLFDLVVSTYGARALPVIEDRLRKSAPLGAHHFLGKYWDEATAAGRQVLGRRFDAWYTQIKGSSYGDDLAQQNAANERD